MMGCGAATTGTVGRFPVMVLRRPGRRGDGVMALVESTAPVTPGDGTVVPAGARWRMDLEYLVASEGKRGRA